MSMPRPTPMRTLGSNTTYFFNLMIMIPAALTVPMLLHIYMLNDLKLEMPSVQAQDFFQQQHKRGQTELQRNISEQCWRTCPQRINKIYYQHGTRGLDDRLTVIDNLAQIAGYLCAILEVPPPSKMLAPKHNNGNRVSEKVKWLDFRNLTFLQDDSQAVRGLDASFSKDFDASPVYKEENFPGWLRIVSGKSDSKGLLEDFIRLQEFSMLQGTDARIGFIWEIHTDFYQSNLFDRLLPPPSAQVQELPGYEDKMLPELQRYYHSHPEEAHTHKRRCTYTNNNPMQLQPTSMVSLVFF